MITHIFKIDKAQALEEDKKQMSRDDIRSLLTFTADLINRVGFPIVVCAFLGWYLVVKQDRMETRIVTTLEKTADAINTLTVVLKQRR